MNSRVKSILTSSVVLILVACASAARADIKGSISGVITDSSGAVVPGVTVVATAVSTNTRYTTVTDAAGFYVFPVLNVDQYNITVSQQGFRDYLETGVSINANSAVRIDIKLDVGTTSSTVKVQSDRLQVETENTQMGDLIEDEKIVSVPLNGRSYIDLLALQPGVSPYQSVNTGYVGVGVVNTSGFLTNGTQSVNGGRPGSNGFMVNGADAEEVARMGAALIPNLDSIAQFRIITNNFNAEYGNYSGGMINVVTKSGNNQYHGDVFDFLRNTDLDAKNYYSTNRGVYIQNQFGGTVGGPIRKDKIFWFGDYQGTKQIIGVAQNFPVPSLEDRSGNLQDQMALLETTNPAQGGTGVNGAYWANILSKELGYTVSAGEPYYSQGCVSNATCVFPNAVIPATAMSPVAQNMMKYIPTPNSTEGGESFYQTSAFNANLTDNKGGIRVDANSRYGAMFAYYAIDKYSTVNPYYAVTVPGFNASNSGLTQMVNLGLTTIINQSTVSDARVVYLRDANYVGAPQGGLGVPLASLGFITPWGPTGGIDSTVPSLEGVPNMSFNNYSFGVPVSSLHQYNNTIQLAENITKVFGTHNLKFGGDYYYNQLDEREAYAQNGQFSFGGQETGYDFADFLLGAPNQFIQGSHQVLDLRSEYYGFYAQDSWRARRTLTINYGLRWDVQTPWYDTQNKLQTGIPGIQSQTFPGAPLGYLVAGDPGVPKTLAPIKYTDFSPRVGFAYAPDVTEGLLGKLLGGPGNTSIRAGYGIFYTSTEGLAPISEGGDAPFGFFSVSPAPTLFATPYVSRATGQVQPNDFPFVPPPTNASPRNPDTTFPWNLVEPISGSVLYYPHNQVPYVQEFDLSLQRQLGSTTVMSLSYVGTVGRHLLTFLEANPGDQALCLQLSNPANVAPGTATCGPFGEQGIYTLPNGQLVESTRPTYGIELGSNPYEKAVASSSYNALLASVQTTGKYGNFLIAYTFEKSMDNGSGAYDVTNPYSPRASRALSVFDTPQDLTVSYTVQLPFERVLGHGEIVKRAASGWALSGISTFADGLAVQIGENDDRALDGVSPLGNSGVDEPNYANNGSKLFVNRNPRKQLPYFNPQYFVQENLGQVGNVMRRFFVGPGIFNSDMTLSKNTKIRETMQLQFRAEAFNVFNHAQFMNPNGNFNNSGAGGFGFVTSARDPRIMQVALKLLF
jgi:Carboxypeptidase regulatory-like domain